MNVSDGDGEKDGNGVCTSIAEADGTAAATTEEPLVNAVGKDDTAVDVITLRDDGGFATMLTVSVGAARSTPPLVVVIVVDAAAVNGTADDV